MSIVEFNRIVVPVEFQTLDEDEISFGEVVTVGDKYRVAVGPTTLDALELAARLARGGELWLVHAHLDFTGHATWMDTSVLSDLNSGARHHASLVLEAVATRHCPDVTLHYVIGPGSPLDFILAVAEAKSADAIVLAASSRSRLSRVFQGSTTDKLIRRARCPVVVVPAPPPLD